MKILSIILVICCLVFPGQVLGQNYIGKHKSEVKQMMSENRKDLYIDTSSRNTVYNMLKYIDNLGMQTLYYFFTEQDTCIYSKWICDYSMLNRVVAGLNEKYEQSAEDSWYYTEDGIEYAIKLAAEDWYFSITTKIRNR
jgi:hypothetical protein